MKKLFGHTKGLKANQIRRLENFYRRRVPPEFPVTPELARDMGRLSLEISRQIGLLINRQGKIASVIVGDHQGIVIPPTEAYRAAPGRLKGVRCIHTHLTGERLSGDDLTDLALLRLDLMAAITLTADGQPDRIHIGHILPGASGTAPYRILAPLPAARLNIGCLDLIRSLESELVHVKALHEAAAASERAFLVSLTTDAKAHARQSLAELTELCRSSGIRVIETVLQQRRRVDSRFLVGLGKLQELTILALQKGATLLVFDQELNPSQIRSITDVVDLKVIDRTQLILDLSLIHI